VGGVERQFAGVPSPACGSEKIAVARSGRSGFVSEPISGTPESGDCFAPLGRAAKIDFGSQSSFSIAASKSALGRAPWSWLTTWPPLKDSTVGMARIPY